MPKCLECGTTRTKDDPDYNPMQLILGGECGWYSGDDGEICGPCMTKLFERANR